MNHEKPRSAARGALWALIAVIVVITYAADFASKEWALRELDAGAYRPLIGTVFGFELVFNPGAAFSFLTGATWVFTILAALVTGVLLVLCSRIRTWQWAIVLALLLGGTLGNLTDRLIRDPGFGVGHVVDFLNYNGYFVGNVADIFIVFAAIGIGILGFIGIPLTSSHRDPVADPGEQAERGELQESSEQPDSREPQESSEQAESGEQPSNSADPHE